MNRRKRTIAIVAVLLVLLMGLPCWLVYRQVEQERKDQALIAAIKADDTMGALELLSEGADGNAREVGETPSLRQVLSRLLERIRHHNSSQADDEHLTALLLLYDQYLHHDPLPKEMGPDLTLVRALLDHHAQVNVKDGNGRSPLWSATCYSNADAVRLFVERGGNMEATDDIAGETPLMQATESATRVLLEHGARTDATASNGRTALAYAALDGHIHVVRLLLQHGAKTSPKDIEGKTALDHVKVRSDSGSRQIAALLQKYGAK